MRIIKEGKLAEIDKEDVSILVNTEGFNYPRYVVLIPDDLLS